MTTRRRHPELAGAVGHGLAALGIGHREGRVACAAPAVRLRRRGVVLGRVAAHLRIREPTRRTKGVDPEVRAKHRASVPLSISCPATEQLGAVTGVNSMAPAPASARSSAIFSCQRDAGYLIADDVRSCRRSRR